MTDRLNFSFDTINDWLEYVIATDIEVPADVEYPQFIIELDIRDETPVESDELIKAMHLKMQGSVLENTVWDQTIWHYNRRIPDELCFYLIENNLALTALGHTRQSHPVLLKLGHLVEEAALTLGKEIYQSDEYGLTDLKRVLNEFNDLYWLWESLIYVEASSEEKQLYFQNELYKRPEFTRIQEKSAEMETVDLIKETDSVEVIMKYYASGSPRMLNQIAANPYTPIDILKKLADIKGVDFARNTRSLARANLLARTGKRFKP